jgi:magnesium transporter
MESVFDITLDQFIELIKNKDVKMLRYLADEMHAVDFAEFLERCDLSESLFIFKTIPKYLTSDIFSYLSLDKQEDLIEALSGPQIKDILAHAQFDDVVDFLEEMPNDIVRKVLKSASEEQRQEINILLSYGKDSAGALLTTEYVELMEEDTVKIALAKVRQQGATAASINTCYVINNNNRLLGFVHLKDIMIENEEALIKDIMETDIISVNTKDDKEDVVKAFSKYDLSVIPAVNDQYGCYFTN